MRRLIDLGACRVNDSAMDLEDLFPSKPGDPLAELKKQDLDPISVEEGARAYDADEEHLLNLEIRSAVAYRLRPDVSGI